MVSPNTDYTSTNFEYPVLTKIHGIPIYEALRRIKDEMKANAASVPCDLGGGAYGHLGLILTEVGYTKIAVTPYVRPIHPVILNIVPGTVQYTTKLHGYEKSIQSL